MCDAVTRALARLPGHVLPASVRNATWHYLLALGLYAVGLLWLSNQKDGLSPVLAVAATTVLCATLGWLTQWHSSQFWARKQHTMTLITQIRTSEVFNRHRINIAAAAAIEDLDPVADAARIAALFSEFYATGYDATVNPPRTPVIDSLFQTGNMLEYMCVGVDQGDLDEQLIYENMHAHILFFLDRFRWFVEHAQVLDAARRDGHGRLLGNTFIGIWYYAQKWDLEERLRHRYTLREAAALHDLRRQVSLHLDGGGRLRFPTG